MATVVHSCPNCEVEVFITMKTEVSSAPLVDCGCPKPINSFKRFYMPHIIKPQIGKSAVFNTLNPACPHVPIRNIVAYISGPISAFLHTDKNAPAFQAAEDKLAAIGFTPLNPLKTAKDNDASWENCMEDDLTAMLPVGLIVMLPGWLGSTGACLEYLNALALGIPVLEIKTFRPVILSKDEWEQLYYNINKKVRENCQKLFPAN